MKKSLKGAFFSDKVSCGPANLHVAKDDPDLLMPCLRPPSAGLQAFAAMPGYSIQKLQQMLPLSQFLKRPGEGTAFQSPGDFLLQADSILYSFLIFQIQENRNTILCSAVFNFFFTHSREGQQACLVVNLGSTDQVDSGSCWIILSMPMSPGTLSDQ